MQVVSLVGLRVQTFFASHIIQIERSRSAFVQMNGVPPKPKVRIVVPTGGGDDGSGHDGGCCREVKTDVEHKFVLANGTSMTAYLPRLAATHESHNTIVPAMVVRRRTAWDDEVIEKRSRERPEAMSFALL